MSQSRQGVAIVGGGLAGMSAALALRTQSADLDITVYESKRSMGGRAGSFTDPQTGEQIDYCQHVAMGCCVNLIAMMKSLDLGDAFTRHRELSFFHPDHPPVRFGKSPLLPAPLHLMPSLIRLSYLSWSQKLEIARATWALMRTRHETLRATTAHEWLVSQNQAPATIRDYWQIVITSALGESCESVSMAAARKVFIDGFLASHNASDVLVPQRPLAELFGVALPGAIAAQNVQFRDATRVRAVTLGADGCMSLRLADESVVCDHVILAVPCQAIAKLISPSTALAAGLPVDRFADVPCSPISGIHLWFDRPVLDRPHAVLVGTLAQWAFSADNVSPRSDGSHYVQVVVSASHALRATDATQIVSQVVDELRHAFPRSASARLLRSRVVTDPQSVFSLRPAVDAVRPPARTALPCLHLAGDFVQTGWPATMEGAVISGMMAASSLLQSCGRPPIAIKSGPRPSLARLLIRS